MMRWILETACSGAKLPSPPLPKNAILNKILVLVFDVVPVLPLVAESVGLDLQLKRETMP
jgi:hypothetical protein